MTDYLYPTSIEGVIERLTSDEGAQIVAGGTDLMPDIRKGVKSPRCLLDITRIPGLDQIEVGEDSIQVGAAVTFADLQAHPFLRRHIPALVEAAGSVGVISIQAVATWVGNIVQAMPAADGAIVALALEAEARVVDAKGAAWRPVESLFLGPGKSAVDPCRQFITHLRFPLPAGGTAWGRIGRRESLVLPILNCAAKLILDNGLIQRAVVALGPVAPRPFRARQAEATLQGQRPSKEVFARAGQIAQSESHPRSNVLRASREYRLGVIPALVNSTLSTAAERAGRAAQSIQKEHNK